MQALFVQLLSSALLHTPHPGTMGSKPEKNLCGSDMCTGGKGRGYLFPNTVF